MSHTHTELQVWFSWSLLDGHQAVFPFTLNLFLVSPVNDTDIEYCAEDELTKFSTMQKKEKESN